VTVKRGERTYEPSTSTFTLTVGADLPATLPLFLFAEKPVDVNVALDGGTPRRKRGGFARRVTQPHVVHVTGEVRTSIVLGDDLLPGEHTLTVTTPGEPVWVHAPWTPRPRAPRPPPRPPHWVEGDLEE
jgi:hypothetical protein